jgi:hypothetical protein
MHVTVCLPLTTGTRGRAAAPPRSGASVVREAVAADAEDEAGASARRTAAFAAAHGAQVEVASEEDARRMRNRGVHHVAAV